MNFILVLLVSFSLLASTAIDDRLSGYIQEFKLTTLKPPRPLNRKLFDIGRLLFHDSRLSGNNNIRCLDCHHPRAMTHDGLPLAIGEGATGIQTGSQMRRQGTGKLLARNTPAVFNLHNVPVLFWDGRVEVNPSTGYFFTPVELRPDIKAVLKSALAAQAIFPMVDHDEMRGHKGENPIADADDEHEAWDMIVEKIMSIPEYQELFAAVYPGEKINIGHFGEALAEFQAQNFFLADTPYDRYLKGDKTALTPKQKVGMDVFFNKGQCGNCHHGEHLTSLNYKSVAAPQIGPGKVNGDDFGRYQWDGNEESKYAFRIPPLRNVGVTAPYFHNGSLVSLEQVVEHYDDVRAGLLAFKVYQLPNYVTRIKDHDHSSDETRLSQLPSNLPIRVGFTEEEEEALIDFLRFGLTDLRLHAVLKQ